MLPIVIRRYGAVSILARQRGDACSMSAKARYTTFFEAVLQAEI